MESTVLPIFICVVLPVAIVWIVMQTRQNETNRRTEIMLKAIEANAALDPFLFRDASVRKGIKERLLRHLTGACITALPGIAMLTIGIINVAVTGGEPFAYKMIVAGALLLAVGIALFIVYFVGRKMMAKEIEAEENERTQK